MQKKKRECECVYVRRESSRAVGIQRAIKPSGTLHHSLTAREMDGEWTNSKFAPPHFLPIPPLLQSCIGLCSGRECVHGYFLSNASALKANVGDTGCCYLVKHFNLGTSFVWRASKKQRPSTLKYAFSVKG